MIKAIKYIWITVAVFLLLIVALLTLTQTAFFRGKLKNKLVSEAEKLINIELTVHELNGNLYRDIELVGISVKEQDSLRASIDKIGLHYRLLPLLKGAIMIDSLLIDVPEVHVEQFEDSTWNFSDVSIKKTSKTTEYETSKSFNLKILYLKINDGKARIETLHELVPNEISNINLNAGLAINGKDVQVDLQHMRFETLDPDMGLKSLSANYKMDPEGIQIDNLALRTGGSELDGESGYRSIENMEGILDFKRIDQNEVELFVPKIRLLCSPGLQTNFQTQNDSLLARIALQHEDQSLVAEVQINRFSQLFGGNGPIPYRAKLGFSNLTMEDWIELKDIKTKLEGTVDLSGDNLLSLLDRHKIFANLRNSTYNDVRFNTLILEGNWRDDDLELQLDAQTDFGRMKARGSILDFSGSKRYDLELGPENFNVGAFFPVLENTVINGRIMAKGEQFKPEIMHADARVWLSESTVYGYLVDSMNSWVSFTRDTISFDSTAIFVPGANTSGGGFISLKEGEIDLDFKSHIDSLTLIDSLIQLPLIFDSVLTQTSVKGRFDKLWIKGNADVYNAEGYNSELQGTSAKYTIGLKKDSVSVAVAASSFDVKYMETKWDSVWIDFNYLNREMEINGRIMAQDTIDLRFETYILSGDTLLLRIPKLEMNTLLSDYYARDTISATVFGTNKLQLSDLWLLDRNNPDFLLRADGRISMTDSSDFHLQVNELDMSQLNRFIGEVDSIGGILDAEISVAGKAENPSITGNFDLASPSYGKHGLSKLRGDYSFTDQKFFAELSTPELDSAFQVSFSAPVQLYIDSNRFVFAPPSRFDADLFVEDMQVNKYLAPFLTGDSISGILNARLKANGEFERPQFYGTVKLDKVFYQNKTLGLENNQVNALLHFDGNKITLDSTLIKQKNGLIALSGALEFDSTLISGNILSSSLQADANNFYVAKNRNFELLIDANTFLRRGQNNPEFGGKIQVRRSDIFLPAVLKRDFRDAEEDEPLLVQTLNQYSDTLSIETAGQPAGKNLKKENQLLSDLTGRISVEIPRNTWIRSNDMRIEIRGDVDIVKAGPYFELFGEITIPRGHYILYGKKLNIEESSMVFEGGETLDPNINFSAEYVYRGSDREKRYLELLVTGKLSEPQINFKLDDEEISETDGISVLIFGTTADEIGFGEQSGLVGSLGSNAAASLITSQLSRTVGAQLNLDMIEVTATENWKSAAFVVGKYITNDIFVIYERGFGEEEGNEITPETITVEYELNEKLFLRLQSGNSITSGVDVILKFEQELEK